MNDGRNKRRNERITSSPSNLCSDVTSVGLPWLPVSKDDLSGTLPGIFAAFITNQHSLSLFISFGVSLHPPPPCPERVSSTKTAVLPVVLAALAPQPRRAGAQKVLVE